MRSAGLLATILASAFALALPCFAVKAFAAGGLPVEGCIDALSDIRELDGQIQKLEESLVEVQLEMDARADAGATWTTDELKSIRWFDPMDQTGDLPALRSQAFTQLTDEEVKALHREELFFLKWRLDSALRVKRLQKRAHNIMAANGRSGSSELRNFLAKATEFRKELTFTNEQLENIAELYELQTVTRPLRYQLKNYYSQIDVQQRWIEYIREHESQPPEAMEEKIRTREQKIKQLKAAFPQNQTESVQSQLSALEHREKDLIQRLVPNVISATELDSGFERQTFTKSCCKEKCGNCPVDLSFHTFQIQREGQAAPQAEGLATPPAQVAPTLLTYRIYRLLKKLFPKMSRL